jgi:1,4-dihydroxy-2-naphthoate octaprenyltransferase
LIFFGPVAVGGTYYVQALQINSPVVLAGLAPGFFSTAILTVNNLRDIESDRRAGKKTSAVRFGAAFAKVEYLLCLLLGCLTPAVLVIWTGNHHYSLFAVASILFAVPTIRIVFTKVGAVLNDALADTGKLLLVYSLLFSIGWLL